MTRRYWQDLDAAEAESLREYLAANLYNYGESGMITAPINKELLTDTVELVMGWLAAPRPLRPASPAYAHGTPDYREGRRAVWEELTELARQGLAASSEPLAQPTTREEPPA